MSVSTVCGIVAHDEKSKKDIGEEEEWLSELSVAQNGISHRSYDGL